MNSIEALVTRVADIAAESPLNAAWFFCAYTALVLMLGLAL